MGGELPRGTGLDDSGVGDEVGDRITVSLLAATLSVAVETAARTLCLSTHGSETGGKWSRPSDCLQGVRLVFPSWVVRAQAWC